MALSTSFEDIIKDAAISQSDVHITFIFASESFLYILAPVVFIHTPHTVSFDRSVFRLDGVSISISPEGVAKIADDGVSSEKSCRDKEEGEKISFSLTATAEMLLSIEIPRIPLENIYLLSAGSF